MFCCCYCLKHILFFLIKFCIFVQCKYDPRYPNTDRLHTSSVQQPFLLQSLTNILYNMYLICGIQRISRCWRQCDPEPALMTSYSLCTPCIRWSQFCCHQRSPETICSSPRVAYNTMKYFDQIFV